MAMAASLLIRAPLSAADDDDAATASSSPSSLSTAEGFDTASDSGDVGPTPPSAAPRPRAAVPALPRIVAQLTATDDEADEDAVVAAADDEEEEEEDFTDADAEEEVVEISNGFFRVARVPPMDQNPILEAAGASRGAQLDGSVADYESAVSVSASASEYFDSSLGFGGNGGEKGAGGGDSGAVEGSLDGSFASTKSVLDSFDGGEAGARRGLEHIADGSEVRDGVMHEVHIADASEAKAGVSYASVVNAWGRDDSFGFSGSVDDKGAGNEGSSEGRFGSSKSVLDSFNGGDVHARGDLEHVMDGSELKDGVSRDEFVTTQGEVDGVENVTDSSEATDSVPKPTVVSAKGEDASHVHVTSDSEAKDDMSEHEVVELPSVVDAGDEGAGLEHVTDDLEAKDSTSKHKVVVNINELPSVMNARVEDASLEHVTDDSETKHSTSEHEVITNVDEPPTDVNQNEVDEEADGDILVSKQPATVTAFGSGSAVELLVTELEDSVPSGKGTHFGLDDSDEEEVDDDDEEADDEDEAEVNKKELEVYDYAALAELLRVANRSSGEERSTRSSEGNAKVFPVETPTSRQPSPPAMSIPRTDISTPPELAVAVDRENGMTDDEKKFYKKVDMIRIKYLRLVHRLGQNPEHMVVTQVLYRLGLAEGFKRIRMASQVSVLDNAWKRALQLEAEGIEDLDFSCNILVLGKTGVGKSATINSIFGEDKSKTNAFELATSSVKEIAGTVDGIKLRVIDTPGLGASVMDEKSNRKILNSVKKYIKRCPPDIVLYVDRIDTQRQDDNNMPLLRCITSTLGLAIWSNAIITLTHSAAAPPEGPSGSPVKYEMVVTNRTHGLQHVIRQATDDPLITNPVALVENHPFCRRNREGEKVLPNGLIYRPQLLLLSYSLKIVSEIDNLSKRRVAPANLFGLLFRTPQLPYFLSSLLQSRVHPKLSTDQNIENGDSDVDLDDLLDGDQDDEDDDCDQLPPFKPLSKSQIAKLTKEQRKSYFDEYDYRIELFQRKQWKEQLRRLKEIKKGGESNHDGLGDNNLPDDYDNDVDKSPMPDWVLPPSFDSDNPTYRYRCLEPTPQLLARAVTGPVGWDHDCGFDGVSLQHSLDVANKFPASAWVQVKKDKKEFTIHLDSSISAKHGKNGSTLAGLDIQTMMEQLAYTLRGEAKFKNLKKNTTTGGLSVTFLGDTMVTGAKLEDQLSVGKRLTLVANTGAVSMKNDTALAVNMEACLRDKDYPIGEALATLGVSLVRSRNDLTMAANLKSQFSVGRCSNIAVHVDLNNKLTGRLSIKTSTTEQLKIALLGIGSTVIYLWNRMRPCTNSNY